MHAGLAVGQIKPVLQFFLHVVGIQYRLLRDLNQAFAAQHDHVGVGLDHDPEVTKEIGGTANAQRIVGLDLQFAADLIMDNTGHLKLSVRLDNLYYIKSDDNYIKVYYIKKGELCNYMLRCKLQSIEDTLPENGSLMRCHRSYIVNIQKVKVLRNESDGFYMDFDYVGIEPIPVSKTYADKVVNRLSNH